MNTERLLTHYERIADAPDAIKRLREFVRELAVRGKLSRRRASIYPSTDRRIDQAKPDPDRSAAPFVMPEHWRAVCIREVLDELVTGPFGSSLHQSDYSAGGTPVINPASIKDERIVPIDKMAVGDNTLNRLRSFCVRAGDVIMARRGEMGRAAVVTQREDGWLCGTGSLILRPSELVDGRFLVLLLGSPYGRGYLGGSAVGTTMQNLNQTILLRLPFGLPPLAEQHRIVAKVDELMALCERLEAARAEREKTRDRLTTASLARLDAPDPDPATFTDHARFALDNLAAFTTRPDQIKQLRQTILILAVRGKLGAGISGTTQKVGAYRSLQNGYAFKSEWFKKDGVRLLRNANVGHGELRWEDTVHLSPDHAAEFQRFELRDGDIVLTLDRPFIVTGTKVARVGAGDLPCLLLQRVGRFVETAPGLTDDYLFLWVNSPHFNEQIDPGRSNGVPHISSKQVEAAELFVPPSEGQQRIVGKVKALMALCDRLEKSLASGDGTRRRLLDALLAEALEPLAAAARKEAAE